MRRSRRAAIALLFSTAAGVIVACTHKSAQKSDQAAAPINRNFSLRENDIRAMVADMPSPIQSSILTKPASFLAAMKSILREPAFYFALVDKQHALPTGYEPNDLVLLADYGLSVSRTSLQMRKAIMPEVTAMVHAARLQHVVLLFSSTYRSYKTQEAVYAEEVRLYGKKVADSESAVPGHSQHQMGTTVDFGCICNDFAKTAAFKWLGEHAWEYGFSMTYPDGYEAVTGYRYEPWHWHYITAAGALAQRVFFDNIQQYLLEFLHENRDRLVAAYHGTDLGLGWKRGP